MAPRRNTISHELRVALEENAALKARAQHATAPVTTAPVTTAPVTTAHVGGPSWLQQQPRTTTTKGKAPLATIADRGNVESTKGWWTAKLTPEGGVIYRKFISDDRLAAIRKAEAAGK